jgi:hypothetical protein
MQSTETNADQINTTKSTFQPQPGPSGHASDGKPHHGLEDSGDLTSLISLRNVCSGVAVPSAQNALRIARVRRGSWYRSIIRRQARFLNRTQPKILCGHIREACLSPEPVN